jgi:CRP/FNR family transcriptional regulator
MSEADQATTTTIDWLALARNPDLGGIKQVWEPNQHVYDTTLPAQSVYVVEQGQVRIYQPGPKGTFRLIEILGPGDWFGVEALARAGHFQTLATAVAPTVVMALPVKPLLSHLGRNPHLITEMLRIVSGKLLNARADAAEHAFDDCNARLINTLLRLSNSAASSQQGDGVVLRITHQELAQAIGVARETVSLALTQLRQRNLLRTGRSQLFFNPDVLRQFSNRPDPEPRRDSPTTTNRT